MKNTIIGIILALLIAGGVYLFMQNKQLEKDTQDSDINITLPLTDDTDDTDNTDDTDDTDGI